MSTQHSSAKAIVVVRTEDVGGKLKHSIATKTETEVGRDHNVALYYGTTTIAFPLLCIQPVVWYHDFNYPTWPAQQKN